MFDIKFGEKGEVLLNGRLDASQTAKAKEMLAGVKESRVVDCRNLEYISSAGLGVLLMTQKRLKAAGGELSLINVNHHIRDVFRYSGLDQVFKIDG
jgi:anti-sigma B factor antagonist